jgi:hypothetical protein
MDGNLRDMQAAMRERQRSGKKIRTKKNGERWNAFGMANADCPSPTRSSIPKWGMKIKLREGEVNNG